MRDWRRLLVAGMAILAIALFAACGGGDDDDDDGEDGSGDGGSSSNNPLGGGSGGGTGSDEKYVGDLCKATLKLTNAFQSINPADLGDESKIFDILEKPYEEFVDAMEDAKPPKDLKDYHDEALRQFRAALKAIEDEDQEELDRIFDAELPDPPAGVEERLDKVARDNKDCADAGVSFEED